MYANHKVKEENNIRLTTITSLMVL